MTPTHRIQQMLAVFVFRREVRRVNDQRELLLRAAEKAGPRRFTGERITAMGELK